MSAIVVDTSALVEYLFRTRESDRVAEVLEEPSTEIHVPELCDIEFVSALRQAMIRRVFTEDAALVVLFDYGQLALRRHGHRELMLRMFELRDNLTAHDAAFVALAERLSVPLVTVDQRLLRAVRAHTDVQVIP
ncbi:MAG TPA: type II toxin-antitoxin system VapC family toxin [Actinomycetota bacterium]|nr:type II toxin-antitoxin system VapC family toxin [Actinomycetota bacterium]